MVINRLSKMTLKKGQKQEAVKDPPPEGGDGGAKASPSHLDKRDSAPSKTDVRRDISTHSTATVGGGGGRRSTSKKMYFIIAFGVYALIAALFLIVHLILLIYIWSSKMSNFISPGTGIFTAVPDAYWLVMRFLTGTFVHFIMALFLILILFGLKKTESFVLRHQDKLLVWVLVVTFIGEYLMFSAILWYSVSYPVVTNGGYADAISAPDPHETTHSADDIACYNTYIRPIFNTSFPRVDPLAAKYTRVNLRWLHDVTCKQGLWKTYLPSESIVNITCVPYLYSLARNSHRDCSRATILYIGMLSQLFMDCLGLIFCGAVIYLYAKAVVRNSPGRISFGVSTYQKDMEQFGQVMKKYGAGSQHKMHGQGVSFAAASSSSKPNAKPVQSTTGVGAVGGAGANPSKVFHHP